MFHRDVCKPKKSDRKGNMPLSLIIYYMLPQLLFGMDYGFIQLFQAKYQKCIKTCSIASSAIMFFGLAAPFLDLYWDPWYYIILLEYILWFLAVNITKYKIYDLLLDMNKIYEATASELRTARILSLDYVIIIGIIKLIILTVQCLNRLQEYCITYHFPFYLLYMVPDIGFDFFGTAHRIGIYYFYCSLRNINFLLKAQTSFVAEEKRYLAIANCYDAIRPTFDYIVSVFLSYIFYKQRT